MSNRILKRVLIVLLIIGTISLFVSLMLRSFKLGGPYIYESIVFFLLLISIIGIIYDDLKSSLKNKKS